MPAGKPNEDELVKFAVSEIKRSTFGNILGNYGMMQVSSLEYALLTKCGMDGTPTNEDTPKRITKIMLDEGLIEMYDQRPLSGTGLEPFKVCKLTEKGYKV